MKESEIVQYCLNHNKSGETHFIAWSVGITNDKDITQVGTNFHIWKCNSYEEANKLRLALILNKQMDNYTPRPTGDETYIFVSKIR